MNYRLFQYSLPAPPDMDDLNAYLAGHRVAAVAQHVVQTASGAMLVFVVETVSAGPTSPAAQSKFDYREQLSAEEFAVFSRLRDERKKMAETDGIPVYAVFSNAPLAKMVKRRPCTTADLSAIDGIGKARVEKHSARLLAILADLAQRPKEGTS